MTIVRLPARRLGRGAPPGAILLATVLGLAQPATAEQKTPDVLCVTGADVFTITDGILKNGTIICRNGKIAEIGAGLAAPEDAQVIDAKGKYVMPGMVAARASLGLFSDNQKLADRLNPLHLSVELASAAGVTTAFIVDGGASANNPIGGATALVKLTPGDLQPMMIREGVALNVSFGNGVPSRSFAFRDGLRRAREYQLKLAAHKEAKKTDKDAKPPVKSKGLDDYLRLLDRQLPARMALGEQGDILAALELVDQYGIRLVIDGGVEAWAIASDLARRNADLIFCPREKRLSNDYLTKPTGWNPAAADLLDRAGVRFALVPPSTSFGTSYHGRDLMTLPFSAMFAVRGGMSEDAALAAITLVPAQIWGIANRVGSLQVGKDADLLVLDGHPLDYHTFVETTIINGKVYYEKDKSTFFSHLKKKPAVVADTPAAKQAEQGAPEATPEREAR